jgi:hypothetical protein
VNFNKSTEKKGYFVSQVRLEVSAATQYSDMLFGSAGTTFKFIDCTAVVALLACSLAFVEDAVSSTLTARQLYYKTRPESGPGCQKATYPSSPRGSIG